jgi:hypothetical protein
MLPQPTRLRAMQIQLSSLMKNLPMRSREREAHQRRQSQNSLIVGLVAHPPPPVISHRHADLTSRHFLVCPGLLDVSLGGVRSRRHVLR